MKMLWMDEEELVMMLMSDGRGCEVGKMEEALLCWRRSSSVLVVRAGGMTIALRCSVRCFVAAFPMETAQLDDSGISTPEAIQVRTAAYRLDLLTRATPFW